MKINIQNTEVELKNTLRSMIIYENIMNKAFQPNGITELIVYFYSVVLASYKDLNLEYDDFLDWLDEHTTALTEFSDWFVKCQKVNDKIKKNLDKPVKEKKLN